MDTNSSVKESQKQPIGVTGVGIAVGAGIGVALGVALNNIPVGLAVGIGAGIAVASVLRLQRKGRDNNGQSVE